MDPDQTAPIGAACFGSTLFASILNSSVMLGNYLQQTTSADDIFRCIFLCALRVIQSMSIPLFSEPIGDPHLYAKLVNVSYLILGKLMSFAIRNSSDN